MSSTSAHPAAGARARARASRCAAALLLFLGGLPASLPAQGSDPSAKPAAHSGTSAQAAATSAQEAATSAEDAARAAELERHKAAEAARLKADFDQYSYDLRSATTEWTYIVKDMQERGVPQQDWPPHPNRLHFSRFEELAYQDQPDALRWCLTTVGLLGLDAATVAEKKNEIYARLVVVHPELPWMKDLAHWVQADGSPTSLGFERADELLRTLYAKTSRRTTRAAVLAARSALLEVRGDDAARAECTKVLRELVQDFAETPEGAVAQGQLFQVEYLVPGKTPPDVAAVDTEGQAVRLADYRGKVLVLDFWGFWCGPCVRSLPENRRLVEKHRDDPFAFLGIATDADLQEFLARARAEPLPWRNAWAGGTGGAWPKSWGIQRFPTVYVLDAQGVVRFTDVRGDALDRAVQTLLDEMPRPAPVTPR